MTAPTRVDLYALIIAAVEDRPDDNSRWIAEGIVDQIPEESYRGILVELVDRAVWDRQRVCAHRIEQEARKAPPQPVTPEPPAPKPDPEPPVEDFQRLYGDPTLWRFVDKWLPVTRRQFRAWCDETHADDGGFYGWRDRGIQLMADEPGDDTTWSDDDMESFSLEWVYDGDYELAISDERGRAIKTLLDDYAARVQLQVTAKLLNTIFATGDGTKVTWRDATVEQHRERIELLTGMIHGTAETAAMHQKAVEMIEAAGVDTLGEVTDDRAA